MNAAKRLENERKYKHWIEESGSGRRYYYDVAGRVVGFARYIKIVDAEEETIFFGQEIYDMAGTLVEKHDKFPIDTGHKKV